MVHIIEGALPLWECAGGYAITFLIIALILGIKRIRLEDIPTISLVSIIFFTASFIHFSIGPSSVHPLFNGIVGITLGPFSYIGIMIALLLQAVLAGHGGISTLGVNTIDMGLPAIIAYFIFKLCIKRLSNLKQVALLCSGLGALTVLLTLVLTIIALVIADPAYLIPAIALVVWHGPIVVIETVITGIVISKILKVRPSIFIRVYGESITKVLK